MIRQISGMLLACLILSGCNPSGYDENAVPDEHRFSQKIFLTDLNEPVELEVLPNGSILFVQRKGGIRLYDPNKMQLILKDSLPVFFGFEDGLMGMALDPNFEENHWVYLYYSPLGEEPKQHLSRFVFDEKNGISDEKIVLVVPTQRDECCHTGGSIEFSADGLLYLSTGDDTNPFKSDGFAPIDDREGWANFDARRSSSNTNDLRGKILRIKPKNDGSYSIPNGNLFEDDDPKTRPEIYVMGCRNPYRITVDQKRGWLFWGDVGPDAGDNDSIRGPRGHDEMNVATKPGYYGWPLFIADNKPYGDYDFDSKESNGFSIPKKPINDSRYNTGIVNLPPATPAMIFYPYSQSVEFPQLTNGGRTAMTGPVFYRTEGMSKTEGFPSYFDDRLFIYDWMRDWIFTILVDENGTPSDFQPFTPSLDFRNIIDMDFGPDGKLYMIEYGTAWFSQNEDAKLTCLSFDRGNLAPVMKVELSETAGSGPLTVTLDASQSVDYDGDELSFLWKIGDAEFDSPIVTHTFVENGVYRPRLTLKDGSGHQIIQQFKVEVGNDAPVVDILIQGNKTFYWLNRSISYDIKISDKQEGSLGNGISAETVNFNIAYLDGLDQAQILGHQLPMSSGESLIGKSDCMSCHKTNDKSVGPSFVEVASRYKNDDQAINYLTGKIIKGGSGAWGDHSMSAHPDFTVEETQNMVKYILSLTDAKEETLPLSGTFTSSVDEDKKRLVFSAQYQDKGAKGLSSLSSIQHIQLMPHSMKPGKADQNNNVNIARNQSATKIFDGSWLMFSNIDLTDIASIELDMGKAESMTVSLQIGQPGGPSIGSVTVDSAMVDSKLNIKLTPTNEVQDIYLVFSSPIKDKDLAQINYLKFIPNE